jgi:ubiquinone/menaquinone biosynthesis C-methylase UbiE
MTKNANDYQYWSKTADRFDAATEYIAGVKTLDAAKQWLSNRLIATDVALEIGCGTGLYSNVIAERVQHLTATDMSPEMLSKARARLAAYSNVTIESADAYRTTYAGHSFDVVFMGNVVRIVQEPMAVLREGHRLLKTGGRLLSIDYTTRGMSWMAQLGMVMRYLSRYGLPPRTMKEYRLNELVELVRGLAFEIQDAQVVTRETNVLCLCAIKQ